MESQQLPDQSLLSPPSTTRHRRGPYRLQNNKEIDQIMNEKHIAEALYMATRRQLQTVNSQLKKANESEKLSSEKAVDLENTMLSTEEDNVNLRNEVNDLHEALTASEANYEASKLLLQEVEMLRENSKLMEEQIATTNAALECKVFFFSYV